MAIITMIMMITATIQAATAAPADPEVVRAGRLGCGAAGLGRVVRYVGGRVGRVTLGVGVGVLGCAVGAEFTG
jgi:hypothetical protein